MQTLLSKNIKTVLQKHQIHAPPSLNEYPESICRGSRDIQLQIIASLKYISEPTDEAWAKKMKEHGMVPPIPIPPPKSTQSQPTKRTKTSKSKTQIQALCT